MSGTLILALLAGGLTVLNPCVLPVLPLVLLGALDEHSLGPVALAAGMVVSFTLFALLVYGAGATLDLPEETVRTGAAAVLVPLGLVLMFSGLKDRLSAAGASLGAPLGAWAQRFAPKGLSGQFTLGAVLGAAWSPCTGPTLGSAIALASQSQSLARAGTVMFAFGVGAVLPMMALAYGSRQALRRRRAGLAAVARVGMPVAGALLLGVGIAILTGYDRVLETVLTDAMPAWLVRFTTRF